MSKSFTVLMAMALTGPSIAVAGPYVGIGAGGTRTESTLQDLGLYPPLLIPTPGDPQFLLPEYRGSPDFSSSDVTFTVTVGWMFGRFVGVEAGYTDFGEARQNYKLPDSPPNCTQDPPGTGGCQSREWTAQLKMNGLQAFVIGSLPLGEKLDAFLKLGALRWEADYSGLERNKSFSPAGPPIGPRNDPVSFDNDDTALAAGLGVNLKTDSPFSVRAEFNYYDVDTTDLVWNAQLMAIYSF